MALQRIRLQSSNQSWNEKRRYKVNSVVEHLGGVFQNTTGKNSDPTLLTDWIKIGSSAAGGIASYNQDFNYIDSQDFEVPGNAIIINIFYNGSLLMPNQYSRAGNIYTIVPELFADDVITFSGVTT